MNKKILFAILLMGFTSLIVQTLLIREFLISFYGNEFTIGIILANWIILEALGSSIFNRSALKAKNPQLIYALFQFGIALYLPAAIFLIRIVKNLLGLTLGEGAGILPVFFMSLGILAPLSMLDGAQFPFGCRILSDTSQKPLESTARVYILEAAGFIIAGPIFILLVITQLNSFLIAFLLSLLNLCCALLLIKEKLINRLAKSLLLLAHALCIITAIMLLGPASRLHTLAVKQQYRGQNIVKYENSIYGNVTVLRSGNQYTFYSDGIPIITTPMPDVTYVEDIVHFSMLSCADPKNIFIISGGAGGIIHEILKYPVDDITYVELDPLLIQLLKEFPTELTLQELNDKKVHIQNMDARRFLRLTPSQYDVIILNLPAPSTLQLNRFYTEEFFFLVKAHLKSGGVFTLSLPGSLSYLSPQMRSLNSSILNTLKKIFCMNPALVPPLHAGAGLARKGGVNIVPGYYNLYFAKNEGAALTPQMLMERLQKRSVSTKLFNSFYLQERLNPRWLAWFNDSLEDYTHTRKNLDLLPSGVFYSIAYWNSIFSPKAQGVFQLLDRLDITILLLGLVIVGFIVLLLRLTVAEKRISVGFAIAATGFTGMSLNLMFIYAYQSFLGYVFAHIAILTAAFMVGLTLGGWIIATKIKKIKSGFAIFLKIELAIVLFCALSIPILLYVGCLTAAGTPFVFFILSAACGCLVGLEFPLANAIYQRHKTNTESAGVLYALDLGGAWLAALVVSMALVPVVGIIKVCVFLVALKIISLALLLI